MRLVSTEASVEAGEPSLLAILETIAAMAIYVWIGVEWGMWWHVLGAAAVAPLLLLRTKESVIVGWRVAASFYRMSARESDDIAFFGAVIVTAGWAVFFVLEFSAPPAQNWAVVVIVGIVSSGMLWAVLFSVLRVLIPPLIGRLLGAVYGALRHPVRSIVAIPANWWRQVLCLDLRHSPELIPIPRTTLQPLDKLESFWLNEVWEILAFCACFSQRSDRFRWTVALALPKLLASGIAVTLLIPVMLPPIAFRLSVKATAIIWLPLIWSVRPSKPSGEPWSAHLSLKAASDVNRIAVAISFVVLIAFVAKYVLLVGQSQLATDSGAWSTILGDRLGPFAVAFVRPGRLPIWQIASALNAVLAITMFLLVRHWVRRQEVGLPLSEGRIDRVISVGYFVRRLLSSYTILINVVVVYHLARKWPIPPIGSKLFPWL